MTFEALASSSHGNAYIVSDGETRILLECGISYRKLQKLSGFRATDFQACLLSHEHKDHSYCVREIIKNGIPVYMSAGTAEALELETAEAVESGAPFPIGTMDVVAFDNFHDAKEPLGFLIRSRRDGDTLAFAIDTVNLRYRFPHLNILAIEANYDRDILSRCERMPEKVKYRITNTHMEIGRLIDILSEMELGECREIHLLHLSDATSHEGSFLYRVARAVPGCVKVSACPREASSGQSRGQRNQIYAGRQRDDFCCRL